MNCETCGALLELRDTGETGFVYRCGNGHWWLLSPTLGWLVVPEPNPQPDPNAAAVPL